MKEFYKKRVTSRPCVPCGNLGRAKPREGRGCKITKGGGRIQRAQTSLPCESNRSKHSLITGDAIDFEGLSFHGIKKGKV